MANPVSEVPAEVPDASMERSTGYPANTSAQEHSPASPQSGKTPDDMSAPDMTPESPQSGRTQGELVVELTRERLEAVGPWPLTRHRSSSWTVVGSMDSTSSFAPTPVYRSRAQSQVQELAEMAHTLSASANGMVPQVLEETSGRQLRRDEAFRLPVQFQHITHRQCQVQEIEYADGRDPFDDEVAITSSEFPASLHEVDRQCRLIDNLLSGDAVADRDEVAEMRRYQREKERRRELEKRLKAAEVSPQGATSTGQLMVDAALVGSQAMGAAVPAPMTPVREVARSVDPPSAIHVSDSRGTTNPTNAAAAVGQTRPQVTVNVEQVRPSAAVDVERASGPTNSPRRAMRQPCATCRLTANLGPAVIGVVGILFLWLFFNIIYIGLTTKTLSGGGHIPSGIVTWMDANTLALIIVVIIALSGRYTIHSARAHVQIPRNGRNFLIDGLIMLVITTCLVSYGLVRFTLA